MNDKSSSWNTDEIRCPPQLMSNEIWQVFWLMRHHQLSPSRARPNGIVKATLQIQQRDCARFTLASLLSPRARGLNHSSYSVVNQGHYTVRSRFLSSFFAHFNRISVWNALLHNFLLQTAPGGKGMGRGRDLPMKRKGCRDEAAILPTGRLGLRARTHWKPLTGGAPGGGRYRRTCT